MKIIAKILLAAVAYAVGFLVSGMITAALHVPSPAVPAGTTESQVFRNMLLVLPLLAAALLPLASGLRGTWPRRLLAVASLLFITLGVNTVIEARAFSNMITNAPVMTLEYVLPALLVAAVLTWPRTERRDVPPTVVHFAPSAWTWRLLVAWLVFPVIYFIFGMMIAPIVVPYYNAGVAGLKIPPMQVVLTTQLVRSALFLLASLPLLMLWRKSRGALIVAMGLAHAFTVGIFGLAQASWFPTILRVTHSMEITADSFAYAAVLALLFVRTVKAVEPTATATTAGN